jgi:hypothetical protein
LIVIAFWVIDELCVVDLFDGVLLEPFDQDETVDAIEHMKVGFGLLVITMIFSLSLSLFVLIVDFTNHFDQIFF